MRDAARLADEFDIVVTTTSIVATEAAAATKAAEASAKAERWVCQRLVDKASAAGGKGGKGGKSGGGGGGGSLEDARVPCAARNDGGLDYCAACHCPRDADAVRKLAAKRRLEALPALEGVEWHRVVLDEASSKNNDASSHKDLVSSQLGSNCLLALPRHVLDEAHSIRNVTSAAAKGCLALRAHNRWAVTGTPMNTDIADLVALLKASSKNMMCHTYI